MIIRRRRATRKAPRHRTHGFVQIEEDVTTEDDVVTSNPVKNEGTVERQVQVFERDLPAAARERKR